MSLLSFIQYIPWLLRLSKKLALKNIRLIFLFFTSGWKSYIGVFLIVIYGNKDLIQTGDPVVILSGIGRELAAADMRVAVNLQEILMGVEGVNYLNALLVMFQSVFLVLWYIRTVNYALYFVGGDNVSPLVRYGVGVAFYVLVVFAVANRFPVAIFELLKNLESIWSWDRLNPLADTNQTLNRSKQGLEYLSNHSSGNNTVF